jgi:valyl-tRNA synthetase
MLGDPTLWLPGTDHAGIATQVMVERDLAKNGKSRHDLGREAFLQRTWDWVKQYGGYITQQHKRLGASCDWSREKFTLDPGPSKAVRTTFVNLYNAGLIYQGERSINWCTRCATALSDLEVEHAEEDGNLYYIRYPLTKQTGNVTVATTRPETLFGDTAIAVNPNDKRYRDVIGKSVKLPLVNRSIPIISDEAVEAEFGTGALKITPGHDPTDFDIGQRHNLPIITVVNLDGTMNEIAESYEGLDRTDCRKAMVEDLEKNGYLEKIEPHKHSVGRCQRCTTSVEPLVSKQWWVRMEPLAKPAIEVIKNGHIRIIPDRFTRSYLNWMENIRDWCISRQLWWGHRIPVWYCNNCAGLTVSIEDPNQCEHCEAFDIIQDPDVLDTWFSSGLWTHSTLGWPDETEDLAYFYPTTVMETAYEILFFWVARMIMMGIQNTGKAPFSTIYLHGLIRDEHGIKMSKTRGNVLDPIKTIESYGTDALRFALVSGNPPGNDSRSSTNKLESSRNFANKLWNAARFVMINLEGKEADLSGWNTPKPQHRHDRWILSRLRHLSIRMNELLGEFQFSEAQRELHEFMWGEFCDWYIEMAKGRLNVSKESPTISPLPTLAYALESVLRLLHPFMPFVTEELWQHLKRLLPESDSLPQSIMISPYPNLSESPTDPKSEIEVELVTDIVRAIRNTRSELRIEQGVQLDIYVDAPNLNDVIREEQSIIKKLSRAGNLHISLGDSSRKDSVTIVLERATVIIPITGVIDLTKERQRLSEERIDAEEAVLRLQAHLKDDNFLGRAPEIVVERERERLTTYQERLKRLKEFIEGLDV